MELLSTRETPGMDGAAVSVLMRTLPEMGWRHFVVTPIAGITGSASHALLMFAGPPRSRSRW